MFGRLAEELGRDPLGEELAARLLGVDQLAVRHAAAMSSSGSSYWIASI